MTKLSSQEAIDLEDKYGAHNYHPLPVVLTKGEGVHVWDVEDKKYFDFLSAYSAVNQGHCHPAIIGALTKQAKSLTLTSRAFYNDKLGLAEKFITEYFGFDKVLLMNSGAEAVETAIKLCRKYSYEKKNIPENQATIIVCEHNFHGRTTSIVSFSSDPDAKKHYGPYTPGFVTIPYNDTEALAKALEMDNIAGFLVEPIQGEAGVFVPDEGYLTKARQLCRDKGVLFIADEVQTGIARTGKLLAVYTEDNEGKDQKELNPDILILGKAISGGVYPVSAVLANDDIMLVIKPGQHGSTFGGNPLACAVVEAALRVIKDEKLEENAHNMGEIFRSRMTMLMEKYPEKVKAVRGKGLLNAIDIKEKDGKAAWDVCLALKEHGLLAKPTHGDKIRFAPPLVITETQIHECCDIIEAVILEY